MTEPLVSEEVHSRIGKGVDKTLHLVAVSIQFVPTACMDSELDRRVRVSKADWRERDILNRSRGEALPVRCHVRGGMERVQSMRRRKAPCVPRLGERKPGTKA
jgi:hypothetical protein